MSEALFLVNPKGKRRRKSRKGRMPAGLRRYWASRRRGTKTRRRRRTRAMPGTGLAVRRAARRRVVMRNPRRRYRRRAIHRNPHRHRHYHHKRNPFSVRGLTHALVPAAIGAGGAIALDVVYAYASPYLPASMQTGLVSSLVKLAGAIGLGMGARKFLGREKGNAVALGALTVTGYGVLKPLIAQFAPTIKGLSGYADYVNYPAAGGQGISGYMPGTPGSLGFYSPASVIQSPQLGAYINQPGSLQGFGDTSWQADGM
jgi:hypothetical protein